MSAIFLLNGAAVVYLFWSLRDDPVLEWDLWGHFMLVLNSLLFISGGIQFWLHHTS